MANSNLGQCISLLYDMELNNYLMTRGIGRLDKRIFQLGHKKSFSKPIKKENTADTPEYAGKIAGILVAVGMLIGVIHGIMTGTNLIDQIIKIITGGILCTAIFGALGIVTVFICRISHRRLEQQKIDLEYELECKKYETNINLDYVRVESELRERNILLRERNALQQRKNEAAEKLREFYGMSGIDSKYQNLVPIGYMNEFVQLGIASELEGVDGLYYLVRQELRWDQMQYTMEEISNKLDRLIDGQNRIYDELVSVNRKCDRLIDTTIDIAKSLARSVELQQESVGLQKKALENDEILKYNTERTRKELSYQNFMRNWNNF